ncbi:MAG: energy transducer TonB [Bacteroidota bacterium]
MKNRPQIVAIESSFPDGVQKWVSYLPNNMVYPERALTNNIQYKVVILFIVDKEGHVFSPEIAQSLEYAADHEAVRLIVKSPSLAPAMQDGKN